MIKKTSSIHSLDGSYELTFDNPLIRNNSKKEIEDFKSSDPVLEEYFSAQSILSDLDFGFLHAGILYSDGTLKLAGENSDGQTTLAPDRNRNIKQISLGDHHTGLLYRDGSVFLFGCNIDLQCNFNSRPNLKVKLVSCGGDHTGFLLEDSTVTMIGANEFGQCNIHEVENNNIRSISLGTFHTGLI
mmetsp:Transcript_46957/g.39615  ORF Transcript_46957/g.39615 Transcript_46957/m.39615 type:complete len:186 (+) Transcript_46957:25-582(+)